MDQHKKVQGLIPGPGKVLQINSARVFALSVVESFILSIDLLYSGVTQVPGFDY